MRLIFITNDPWKASVADRSGVQRVMVDLETLGKHERQAHRDTRISEHTVKDVGTIRKQLHRAELMVRVNPIHAGSRAEIHSVIERGATSIMLPMARTGEELTSFVEFVAGRANTCLLLETAAALGRARQLCETTGLDEVHVGLNDLHVELGLDFMFEVVAWGLVEHLAGVARAAGRPFGFGGVARLNAASSAVPAEWVLSEHVRIGSSQVILSRDFDNVLGTRSDEVEANFAQEVGALQRHVRYLRALSLDDLAETARQFAGRVAEVSAQRRHAARLVT